MSPPLISSVLIYQNLFPLQRKSDPVITVYETQANLADHEKIQGTDGSFSSSHI